MIALRVLVILAGTLVSLAVLISALKTVVLPRGGFTRISRVVFAVVNRVLVHRWRDPAREDNLRALYAPVALVTLPLVWTLAVTVGFTGIFWGAQDQRTWIASFKISGSSLFTLGFDEPTRDVQVWIVFVEATIGLGLVALLISYLPTIYAAHASRERGMDVLRPFAGTPPSPLDFLRNLSHAGAADNPELWKTAWDWLLDLERTHSNFPALSSFPDSKPGDSWVASVGTMLDAAAILVSVETGTSLRELGTRIRGPLLILTYGVPALVRVGRSAALPLDQPPTLVDSLAAPATPVPISISREEYLAALDRLAEDVPAVAGTDRERSWDRFAAVRSGYDHALRGLAGLTMAGPAPWSTDRPARVARPRLIGTRPVTVDWSLAPG